MFLDPQVELGASLPSTQPWFRVRLPLTATLSSGNQEPLHAAPVFARHINFTIVDDGMKYVLGWSKGSVGFCRECVSSVTCRGTTYLELRLIYSSPARTHIR